MKSERFEFYLGVLMGTWFTQWISHDIHTPWGAAWMMTRIAFAVLVCRTLAGWAFDEIAKRRSPR